MEVFERAKGLSMARRRSHDGAIGRNSVCKDLGIIHFPAPLIVVHLIFIPVLKMLATFDGSG